MRKTGSFSASGFTGLLEHQFGTFRENLKVIGLKKGMTSIFAS